MNDVQAMGEAITLAKQARGSTSPNPMVGAVVVNDTGKIIGRGFHPKAGEPHAEVFAIRQALEVTTNLSQCTLYVTLEPCNHFGRTPPCVDLILKNKISQVVVGSVDPHSLMQGKSIVKLREAGVKVEVGLLASSSDILIRGFKTVMKHERPFVTLKSAASLDGKIATASGESRWITGVPARQMGHQERAEHDSILIGVGTILADDPQLNIRVEGRKTTHELTKIILDSHLRTPPEAKVLRSPGTVLIYCAHEASTEKQIELEKNGAQIIRVARDDLGYLALGDILKDSTTRGVQELLVEGGAKVLGAFVRSGLFDRLLYFIAPRIMGSGSKDAFEGVGLSRLQDSLFLENISTRLVGRDIVVEGTRVCSLA